MTRSALFPILAVAGAAVFSGCTASAPGPSQSASQSSPAAPTADPGPPVKVVGAPVKCVPIQSIREARVLSDSVIDFHMNGGQVLRNRLPNGGCPQLGFERAFTYSTSLSQLCNVDIITVIRNGGISRGASCGLGDFTPIALVNK